ncbi:hypothetical protein RhiirA5_438828 [Rhizophagus irregularis]|uniref:Uncharacterized protein n=1 Tax=Rhizophagus irregularis TaxID=588596 RepID=A0A2N0NIL6_9GLOM|nr:hypothetical protein RhiirA5_438828 [Rhizophagus irregularis]
MSFLALIKRPTPSLTRQLNPRNLERVDYNVGPPSRKRHKKPVPQPPPEPSSSPSLHSLSIPSTPLPLCLKCPQHCF